MTEPRERRRRAASQLFVRFIIVLACFSLACGCRVQPPSGRPVSMLVTAYCPCGTCCSWHRNWYGRPVFSHGANAGTPKEVGVCADGTRAELGTIAADTQYYPFGTRLYVPGYGYGVVHDRGGDILGPARIDVFYKRHRQALRWGRRKLPVVILDQ